MILLRFASCGIAAAEHTRFRKTGHRPRAALGRKRAITLTSSSGQFRTATYQEIALESGHPAAAMRLTK
jgi:hypothetical protein